MKTFRILIVDDEERIRTFLKSKLSASGYEVIIAKDGTEALEKIRSEDPDLVLLDVLMPRLDGIETLKEIRTFSAVPVIILSAKGSDTDKIKGLNLGADDYVAKPFNPSELLARIEAVKRRALAFPQPKAVSELRFGDVIINFERRTVFVGREEKKLTRIEWLLLAELARNAGRLMLHSDLLTRVWGPEYRDDVQILRTWMSRLRSKLEKDPDAPSLIRTVPKIGYILDRPAE